MTVTENYYSAVSDSIDKIDARQWNALRPDDQPFTSHEFLSALERCQCVGAEAGWIAQHLTLHCADGQLVAAMPLYLKDNSWGEFVFDFAWAEAYARAGRDYFPKLVSMCPFTPVTGWRILSDAKHPEAAKLLLRAAIGQATDSALSSLHILYPQQEELRLLQQESLIIRQDVRFMWQNDGYSSFDEFIATFSAGKRKKIKRERRRVAEQQIAVTTIPAEELTDLQWATVFALCSMTFLRRGHRPYIGIEFFQTLAPLLGDHLLVNIAQQDQRIVGAAILFRDSTTLYGRYWGGLPELDCLHFETCYYRGIDYCIENKLDRFDPGTQGEHKLRRGFAPVPTWSAHWVADPDFKMAIARYLAAERKDVIAYMDEMHNHLPFRQLP